MQLNFGDKEIAGQLSCLIMCYLLYMELLGLCILVKIMPLIISPRTLPNVKSLDMKIS